MHVFAGLYIDQSGESLHVELGEDVRDNMKAVKVTGYDSHLGHVSFVTRLDDCEEALNDLGNLLHSCEYLGEL